MASRPVAPERLFTRGFALVFASSLVFFTAGGAVLPVAPRFAVGPVGADAIGFGVAIGVFSLASLVARPAVGWAADRFGRRPLLVGGAAVTALALFLHVFAAQLPAFVLVRALLGAAEAAFLVAAIAGGSDLAPPGRTGEAISLVSLSIYMGVVVGPVLGEALLGVGGFTLVWVAAAAISAVSAVLALLAPETFRPAAGSTERRPGRLFHPAGLLPGVIVLCGLWGMAAFLTFVPLYAVDVGLAGAGPALAVFGVVVIAVRALGAKLPDRTGPVRLTAIALAATTAGLLVIGLLPGQAGLLAGTAVLAFGVALTMPSMLAATIRLVPEDERGSVVGTTSLFLDLSFGFVPVALAPVAAAAGYPAVFLASAGVALLGLAVLGASRGALVTARAPAG